MAKLLAPENCSGCSHDNKSYEVDEDGMVEVPEFAVADLLNHGFTAPTLAELKSTKKAK